MRLRAIVLLIMLIQFTPDTLTASTITYSPKYEASITETGDSDKLLGVLREIETGRKANFEYNHETKEIARTEAEVEIPDDINDNRIKPFETAVNGFKPYYNVFMTNTTVLKLGLKLYSVSAGAFVTSTIISGIHWATYVTPEMIMAFPSLFDGSGDGLGTGRRRVADTNSVNQEEDRQTDSININDSDIPLLPDYVDGSDIFHGFYSPSLSTYFIEIMAAVPGEEISYFTFPTPHHYTINIPLNVTSLISAEEMRVFPSIIGTWDTQRLFVIETSNFFSTRTFLYSYDSVSINALTEVHFGLTSLFSANSEAYIQTRSVDRNLVDDTINSLYIDYFLWNEETLETSFWLDSEVQKLFGDVFRSPVPIAFQLVFFTILATVVFRRRILYVKKS